MLALSLFALWRISRKRPRALLDLWLMVAMAAWVAEVMLSCLFNTGRFDLGFYAGRLYGLAASLLVLGAVAIDNIALHARLRLTFEKMLETQARARWQGLLGSVLRQLPDGVLIVDREGRCVMANEQAEQIEARFEHAAGDGTLGPAAMLAQLGEPVRRALEGCAFREVSLDSVAADGRRVYAVSGAPLRDSGPEAAAVIVLDDITASTQANAALARALDQTRYLIENTPLAVIEWDRDFIIRLWNRRAEELFGWTAGEALGRRIDALPVVHEDDAGKVAQAIGRLLDSATRYVESNNRNRSRDGRILCCEWYNSVLHDEGGAIHRVFSLVLDVSEREAAMEQLKEADRRKDVYIATLAHELRNPLAPIANAASLLRGRGLAAERVEWIAAMVGRQAAQMSRLLDDLLDVTRISRGKIELRRAPLELGRLLRDTLQTSMPLIETGRHTVELDLCDEPVWVEADALRLTQVLANLINNAAKYTPPGGRIAILLKERDGEARVEVRDNGVGIEPEMVERVFDAFVQVSSASHLAQGGLGIGLSLARGLVELHGGRIAARSDGPGQGAVFTVWLPAIPAPLPAPGAFEAGRAPPRLRKTILVADDNADAAESLAWLLRSEGATVDVAHDGARAAGRPGGLVRRRLRRAFHQTGGAAGVDRPAAAVVGWAEMHATGKPAHPTISGCALMASSPCTPPFPSPACRPPSAPAAPRPSTRAPRCRPGAGTTPDPGNPRAPAPRAPSAS